MYITIRWIKGVSKVMEGRSMAKHLFDSFEPSAVVGFGGYPSLPALLAARSAISKVSGSAWAESPITVFDSDA